MSMTFSNIYNENKPTKVDFEKRVNLKDLMNEDLLTVIEISYMKTQFGIKALAILEDQRWFYIPESADKMREWSLPATFHVTEKVSKIGRKYVTVVNDSYVPNFKNVSIKDLVGKTITINSITAVETKYGMKYRLHICDGEYDGYDTLTSFEYLYTFLDENHVDISEGLTLKIITKKNKEGTREYIWFE